MRRIVGFITAAGLLSSACVGGGEPELVETAVDTTQVVEVESTAPPTTSISIDEDVAFGGLLTSFEYAEDREGPHPVDEDPVWSCGFGSVSLTLDQLLGFATLPPVSDEAFAAASSFDPLGSPDEWGTVSDKWIAHRELLDTEPAALVLADATWGGALPCVPIRQTSMRPVAWVLSGDPLGGEATLAIEGCVHPDALVIDTSVVDDRLLVGLFAADVSGSSCIVDGETTATIANPDGLTIVSSQHWPFEPAGPDRFYTANTHPRVTALDPGWLDQATCTANGSSTEVSVSYLNLPNGLATAFYSDGEYWLDHVDDPTRRITSATQPAFIERMAGYGAELDEDTLAFSEVQGIYSYFGAQVGRTIEFQVRVKEADGTVRAIDCGSAEISTEVSGQSCSISTIGGQPSLLVDDGMNGLGDVVIVRDGEVISTQQGFGLVDATALPDVEYVYEVDISSSHLNRPAVRVPCGSFTVSESFDPVDELLEAREAFQFFGAGAHIYMTFVDADGTTLDLALAFIETDFGWVGPTEAPAGADPLTLHDRLIAAVEAGSDVTFEIDPAAGVVTRWSIDGVESQILCLEFDTAPLELRDIECGTTNDLIGPRP